VTELTVAGTALVLHQIPFSSAECGTKLVAKIEILSNRNVIYSFIFTNKT